MLPTIFFACLLGQANESKPAQDAPNAAKVIVVDENKDGLPGATVGPSRKDIEDLIRAIGRDPVSDELVDRIDALFRPRWASGQKFGEIRERTLDPAYVAKLDAAMLEITKKPADTRILVEQSASYSVRFTRDDAVFRTAIKEAVARETGPRKTIKGRIVDDENDKPIVGAVITSQDGMIARTDAKGEYVLKTREAQNFVVTIEASGYALTQSMLRWNVMADPEMMDYRLPRSAVFGGRIIDPDGKPIVGADVELWTQPKATFRDTTLEKQGIGVSYTVFRAGTDSDGIYAFRNIPPDNESQQQWAYQLNTRHPKFQPRTKRYAANELLGPGWEINMEPGFVVRGVVVDESGKPVPKVQVRTEFQPNDFACPVTLTNDQGQYRFDNLPLREIQLTAHSDTHLDTIITVQSEKAEPPETKITLRAGEYFEGKVVDESDKPVGGVSIGYVTLVDADNNVKPSPAESRRHSTTTRDDGTFRIGPFAKGRYRLRAIRSGDTHGGEVNGFSHAESGSKNIVIKFGTVGK